MKFSEMPYTRPDAEALKKQMSQLTERLQNAASYEEARQVFLEKEAASRTVETQATLASIRHSIDTRDTFYDGEEKFWNTFGPELEEYEQAWKAAMLDSPFRKDFSAEYGDLMFLNAEIARKCFKPEIIPEMQQENDLTQEYEKLLASAQIPFEGKTYTLSQLTPLKSTPTTPAVWRRGRPMPSGPWSTRRSWMNCTTSWCICVIPWARRWATRAIPRWATTA